MRDNKGINTNSDNSTNDQAGLDHAPTELPFVDGDDIFLRKKPVNLFITLALFILALIFAVVVAKDYFRKVNDQELLQWETGRLNKAHIDAENAKKHDLFQPLRENWAKYISAKLVFPTKKSAPRKVSIVVENKSPKPLEQVVVNLYSINWNGEASGVKSFTFRNIRPSEIKQLNIEAGVRSKEAFCVIKSITASSFSFCFDKDMETAGKSDPYYCNGNSD